MPKRRMRSSVKRFIDIIWFPYCFAEDMWVATVNFWFPERS